jgi:hypothetical protein
MLRHPDAVMLVAPRHNHRAHRFHQIQSIRARRDELPFSWPQPLSSLHSLPPRIAFSHSISCDQTLQVLSCFLDAIGGLAFPPHVICSPDCPGGRHFKLLGRCRVNTRPFLPYPASVLQDPPRSATFSFHDGLGLLPSGTGGGSTAAP